MECSFRNYIIQWQMSKSTNVIFYIFDFRQGVTCANDSNTQTHTQTKTNKPLAIGESC